jgi:hypothetical protein
MLALVGVLPLLGFAAWFVTAQIENDRAAVRTQVRERVEALLAPIPAPDRTSCRGAPRRERAPPRPS